MKKLSNKIKQIISSSEFKASFWTLMIEMLIFIPILILFITIMKQYSIVTNVFWIAVYIFFLLLIILICFGSVIYEKLVNIYQSNIVEKGYYWNVLKKEIFGPFGLAILLSGSIIFVDQFSKILAINYLSGKGSVEIINKILNFKLAYNKGAAWSMCSEHTDYLAILSLLASIIIVYFLKDFNMKDRKMYSIAMTFILGGTIGNMIDRFFRLEGVVDFIEVAFIDFPIFNVADSFLVIGTIMLMVDLILLDYFRNKKAKNIEKYESIEENNNE